MDPTYIVSKRGPHGEPQEIHCQAHPGCAWRMQSMGAKTENDPVFVAQFRNHLEIAKVPDAKVFGHERRSRRR